MGKLGDGLSLIEAGGMVIVPGARYTSPEFFDLETQRLWRRVWQIACREEEVPDVGDFVEYKIVDDSILVVRSAPDTIKAFHNVCPHRGRRLACGEGTFATCEIRCGYHGWRWTLDGDIVEVVDRHDFPETMTDEDVRAREVQVGRWGGFVFVNVDPTCESFESFLGGMPEELRTYRFENMRFRSYRSFVAKANWKTCIDSFQEGYHPQTLHAQMLTWFDDTRFVYRQIGKHSLYGGDGTGPDEPRPSPRLGLEPGDYDERELTAIRVDAIRGLFPREMQQRIEDLKQNGPPPGKTLNEALEDLRVEAMASKGIDLSGLSPEELREQATIHLFPNLVGPISHGNATLYRARPNGRDPESSILDFWALEWTSPQETPPLERKVYGDWSEKDWGLINNQDFGNFAELTLGMRSSGFEGARLNPVQEANIVHHQRVLDEYLAEG